MPNNLCKSICILLLLNSLFCYGRQTENNRSVKYKNLAAFCQVYGVVKYFQATRASQNIDWQRFAVWGIQHFGQISDQDSLIKDLNEYFQLISPDIRILATEDEDDPDIAPLKDQAYIWEHRGNSRDFNPKLWKVFNLPRKWKRYHSEVIKLSQSTHPHLFRRLAKRQSLQLSNGLYLHFSVAVPRQNSGNLRKLNQLIETISLDISTEQVAQQPSYRLASLCVAWNALKYFITTVQYNHTEWTGLLLKYLPQVSGVSDLSTYMLAMQRFFAELQDGHTVLKFPDIEGGPRITSYTLPLSLYMPDDTSIFVKEIHDIPYIETGDQILSIDGTAAITHIRDCWQRTAASTHQYKRVIVQRIFLTSHEEKPVHLILKRGEKIIEHSFQRTDINELIPKFYAHISDTIRQISPKIYYVDLRGQLPYWGFRSYLEEHPLPKGFIFDLRGYPGPSYKKYFLKNFIQSSIYSDTFYTPLIYSPFNAITDSIASKRASSLSPYKPLFDSKCIFLTDASAISAAETYMSWVKNNHLGIIVGDTTAGTNGTITMVQLPVMNFLYTGQYVVSAEGTYRNKVGIPPDVRVRPTLAGIKEGRDEVLEHAIKLMKEMIADPASIKR